MKRLILLPLLIALSTFATCSQIRITSPGGGGSSAPSAFYGNIFMPSLFFPPNFVLQQGLDQAGDFVAFTTRAPKAGVLDGVEFDLTTFSGGAGDVRVSFQDVNLTNGDPDFTADQYRDITAAQMFAGPGVAWTTLPGPMTSDGTNSGTKRTVAAGELFMVVFTPAPSMTTINVSTRLVAINDFPNHSLPAVISTNGGINRSRSVGRPLMALKYADGTYGQNPDWYPLQQKSTTNISLNVAGTRYEAGMKLVFPKDLLVNGIYGYIGLNQLEGRIRLYEGEAGTTLLEEWTIDDDTTQTPSDSPTGGQLFILPITERTLKKDVVYRLVGASVGVGFNMGVSYSPIPHTALLQALPGGSTWVHTTRTGAPPNGAWLDEPLKRSGFGFIVSGM